MKIDEHGNHHSSPFYERLSYKHKAIKVSTIFCKIVKYNDLHCLYLVDECRQKIY